MTTNLCNHPACKDLTLAVVEARESAQAAQSYADRAKYQARITSLIAIGFAAAITAAKIWIL